MTGPARVCRHCDEVITDPEDAVIVGHDAGNSGPGWTVWAHRDHAELVDTLPDDFLRVLLSVWGAQVR
ncbi:hypothetical protein ACGFOM_18200 [Streptomyces sp. NPDC048594]|uniref:hypothetical protein n=1 Tax=Streptomyces sp. NPDC048594 TaxID=3365575 RepID=UPI003715257C